MQQIRILILLLLITFSVTGYAQRVHPYLFFPKERVDALKERIKTDTFILRNWNSILKEANDLLEKGDTKGKIDFLAIAYLVTNDNKYSEKIKEVLLKLCTQKTWSNEEMLKRKPAWASDLRTAGNCHAVAVGYDAVYNNLSKDERKTIVDGLVRMGIKPALNEWVLPETRIHTLNSMGHNWWSSCVGMAGIAALAILNDHPEASEWVETISKGLEEWYLFNGDELQHKPKTMDDNGGMYESVNYAAFGLSEFLFFRLAYQNTFPQKQLPEIKGLKNFANWFYHVSYPRTGQVYSLNFGDHHLTTACDRPVKLLYSLGYMSDNALWYLNQVENNQHREGLFPNTPVGIVYQPAGKAPKVPDLPTSAIFEDMDWASMRTSWEKDATMLGVKCGYTWNHSHADAASFILFHKGEVIIKDAGNCSYGQKEYPEYFFQSQAHNVMMFNVKAQPREQQYSGSPLRGSLSNLMDCGSIKYIQANATGPTSANFQRNFRHFIWLDKLILILDDVKAYETGKFQWLLHPEGASKKVGGSISIINGKSSTLVRPLFPETLVETGFNHDFPEKLQITEVTAPKARDPQNPTEMYYSFEYPQEVKQTKFLTAIILKDSVNDKNLPEIERLHNENMIGVRIKYNGKITDLYVNLMADTRLMHLNSCASFDGWDTDAYMFGITYPEGQQPAVDNISNYFMVYGSYIRKSGTIVFSSLSKLYMVTALNNGKLEMALQGQPLINAILTMEKKPSTFILNGVDTSPFYINKQLKIRVEKN